jgi:hypothetical protein
MRSHGVPNYPDPTPGVDLVKLLTNRGVNPASPAFQSAQTVCSRLLPGGGGPGSMRPSAQDIAQAFRVSECMRQHGVSDFPDPTLAPPSNQASYDVIDRGGVFLDIPNTISTASPAFSQAATACRFPH